MTNPCIENRKNMKNDPIPYIRIHRKKEKGKLDRDVVTLCKTQLEEDLKVLKTDKKNEITRKYDIRKESITGKEIKRKRLSPLEKQIMKAEDIIKNHKNKLKF